MNIVDRTSYIHWTGLSIGLIADSEEHLQRMLDFLSHWCSQNKMSVNISKTKVVHFRKKNKALTDLTGFKLYSKPDTIHIRIIKFF